MPTTRETLVDIYHPAFRRGYQKGREHYFQEQIILTDKALVECLQSLILDTSPQEHECDDDLYYAIGQLVGQMSACVIPCQSHEDQTQRVRECFLRTLQRANGPVGEALLDLIRRYWEVQDQLARLLDADAFDQVLHSGEQRGGMGMHADHRRGSAALITEQLESQKTPPVPSDEKALSLIPNSKDKGLALSDEAQQHGMQDKNVKRIIIAKEKSVRLPIDVVDVVD